MHLLHIVATPRGAGSNTLRIAGAFLDGLREHRPDLEVETVNPFDEDLPDVAGGPVDAKYSILSGAGVPEADQRSWAPVEHLIEQFMGADAYLLSSPMWNFHIPSPLKRYIDAIVQPGYLFSYDANGVPVGLCTGRPMLCVTTRGGDYSVGSPLHAFDLQEAYLRTIFGFVGIADVRFVHAQPMDLGPELRAVALESGATAAREVAGTPPWSPGATVDVTAPAAAVAAG